MLFISNTETWNKFSSKQAIHQAHNQMQTTNNYQNINQKEISCLWIPLIVCEFIIKQASDIHISKVRNES